LEHPRFALPDLVEIGCPCLQAGERLRRRANKFAERPAISVARGVTNVDAWAVGQEDEPSRSEAIRRLVELGLKKKP
jgi:hypothetical protein